MKKIVLLTCISIVIILIAIIIYFVLPWWAIYTELQSSPNIIEPKVRNAQFSFKIEYEVNGERYTLEDTLECEYVLSINEGTGKS